MLDTTETGNKKAAAATNETRNTKSGRACVQYQWIIIIIIIMARRDV